MLNPVYSKGEGENAIRKPLHECTMEECYELKTMLFDKYQKLASIGKGANAMQFLKMMQQVDERIGALQIDLSRQDVQKQTQKKEKPSVKDRGTARKSGYNPNRWTSGTAAVD